MTFLFLFLTKKLNKEKFLFYSNIYSGFKSIINILISGLIVIFLNRFFDIPFFADWLLFGCFFAVISTFDSWLIFRKTKAMRNLSMTNKEYIFHCIKNYVVTSLFFFVIALGKNLLRDKDDFTFIVGILSISWIVQFASPYLTKSSNKITKFENDEMIKKLSEICPRKFKIFVYEGSKQKSANAVATGTFLNRHIFISTYFLENSTEDEIFAILLHECGHCEFFDLEKRVLYSNVWIMFYFIAFCFMDYFKIEMLPGFIFLGVCLISFMSLYKWIQRFQEYRADRYSVNNSKNKNALSSALERMYILNDKGKKKGVFWNIISSHPIYKKRINRINSINLEKE